jgi:hypothetical protein
MKIHAGYEISYTCLQPTPMILMLSVHLTRPSWRGLSNRSVPCRRQYPPAPAAERNSVRAHCVTAPLK